MSVRISREEKILSSNFHFNIISVFAMKSSNFSRPITEKVSLLKPPALYELKSDIEIPEPV
jgi:hypothetical protein